MKAIVALVLMIICAPKFALAKVLTAEGTGVTEVVAKANAYRQLSEQVAVSVEAAYSAVTTLNGDSYTDSYFDKTMVSSSAQFAEVSYELLADTPVFTVRVSVDVDQNLTLYRSRLQTLSQRLSGLLKHAADINELRQLMDIAQQYQSAYEQMVILSQLAGQRVQITSVLVQHSEELNLKIAQLDAQIVLTASAIAMPGETTESVINRTLKMLAQQLGVEVAVATQNTDTLINNEFNSEFSDTSSINSESVLLGVTINEEQTAQGIQVTATLAPRKVLPIYTERLTEYINQSRQYFGFPVAINALSQRASELKNMNMLVQTAISLAGFVGIQSVMSAQDRMILDMWHDILQQSERHWREYEFDDLAMLADFLLFELSAIGSVQLCPSVQQTMAIENKVLARHLSPLVAPPAHPSAESRQLVWFVMQEQGGTSLVIRVLDDNNVSEYEFNIAPTLIVEIEPESSANSRLLLNLELAGNQAEVFDENFYYTDLRQFISSLTSAELVQDSHCLRLKDLNNRQIQQIYNVERVINLALHSQIGQFAIPNSEIKHNYAATEISWMVQNMSSGAEKAFTTTGKKFPAVDNELSLKEAFNNGLAKAQQSLLEMLE